MNVTADSGGRPIVFGSQSGIGSPPHAYQST